MKSPRSPLLLALLWLLAAAVAVPSLLLLRGPSTEIYLAVTARTADLPGVELVSEIGVITLALLWLLAAWQARGAGLSAVATAIVGGGAAVVAYVTSEVAKTIVQQPRGCWDLIEIAHCPEAGDWSFPSNHTTIAFALGTAVVLTALATGRPRASLGTTTALKFRRARRLPPYRAMVVAPVVLAVVTGAARLVQGVHFPHDVLAGAVVGVCVVVAVVLALRGPMTAGLVVLCRNDAVRRVLLAPRATSSRAEGDALARRG
ncbi:phosphatase PAP2 family protein [Oerskovia turbata]